MDLSNLSLSELRALALKIQVETKRREGEEITRARQQILSIAQSVGIPLSDLIDLSDKWNGKSSGVPRGTKLPVRFRHPRNPTLRWTGRGRQPHWVSKWLADGGTMKELEVGDKVAC